MNKRLLIYFLAFLSSGFLMLSCTGERKIIKQPIKEEGIDHVFNLLKKNEFNFNCLTAKFSASISIDKKESNISGQFRLKRDSLIWVSLTPALGLEAARILINLDSVMFMNRIDNTYLKTDFTFINDYLNSGFDFDLLQSLLIGNDLRYYENDQFKVNLDEKKYKLNTVGRRKLKKYVRNHSENQKVLIQNIWLNPETGKIEKVSTKELGKDNKKLETDYSQFEMIGDQLFPHHLSVKIDAEKSIRIEIDLSKVKRSDSLNFPFTIPQKYTRIPGY